MAPGSTEPSGKPCPGKAKWNPLSVVMGGGGSWPVFYSSSCSPAGNVSGRLNRALNRFRRNRSLLPYHTGHPTNLMSLGFSQNTCKMGEAIRIGNSLILNVPEGNRIHDEDIQKLARDTNTQEKSAISVSRPEIPEDPAVRLPTPKEGRAGGMSDANPLEQLLSVVGVLTSSGRYYPSAPEYRPNVLEERSESSLSDAYFEECRSLERLLDPDQSEWWMESGCFGDRVANSDLEKSEDVNLTRHGSARNLSETESGFSHKPKSTVLVAKDQLSKTESTCLNADQQAKTRSSTSISAKKTVSSSRSKAVSNEKSGTSFKSKACTASKQGVSKDPSAPCQRESKSETDLEDKTSSLVTAQEKRAYFFVAESIADTECTGEIKEMRDSIRQGSLQTQRSGKSSRFDRQSSRLHRQEVPFKQVIDAESVWKNVHMISSSRTVHTQTEPWNQLTSKNSVTRSVHSRCRRPQTVFFSSGTENLEVQVKAPPPILCERCSSALNPLWRKQLSMCSRMSDASVCNSNSGQTEFSTKEATTVMLSCGGVQGLLNYILQPERNEKDERLSVQRERSEEGRLHIQPDRSEKEVRLSIQPKQSEKERLSSTQKRSEKDRLSSTQKRSEKDQLSSQQKQSEKERLGVQPKRSEKDRLSSTRKRSEKDQLSSQQKQSEKERLSVQPKRSEKDHLSNLPERSEKDSLSVKPQHSEKEVRMSVQTQCSHRDHEKFGSDAVSPTYRIPKEGGIQLLTDRGPVVLVEPPKLKRRGELTSKEFQSSHENRVQVSSRSISVHSLHSQSHTNKSRNESGLASPRNSEVETSAENTNAVSNMSKVKSGPDKIREIMPPKPVLTSMKSTQRSSRLLEAVGVARKRDEEAVAKAFDGQVEATSLFARGNVSSEEKDLEKGGSVHVDQDAAEIPETSDDLDDIGGEGSSETPAAESESSSDESLEYSASSSASSEESYVVSPETLDISKGNSGDQYADFNLRTFPDVPQSDRFNVSGVIRENNTKTPSDVIPETNTRSDVVLEPSSKASGDVDVFVESGKKSSKPRFPIRLPLRAAQELEAQNESALGVNSPESEGKRVEGNRGLTVKGIVPLLTMAYIPMSSPQKGNKGQKKSQVHALERTSNTTTVGTTMGELSKAKLKLMGDVDTKSLQIDLRETEGEVVSTQTSKMSKEAFRDPSMEEFVAREIARLVVETESQKSGNKALPDDVPDKMRSHLINLAKKENVGSDVIPTTFYARKENGGWKVVLEYTTDSNKNVKKYRKRFPDAKSIMAIEPGKEGEMPETSSRPVVAHVVKRNFLSAASSSASDEFQIVRKWQIYRRVGGSKDEIVFESLLGENSPNQKESLISPFQLIIKRPKADEVRRDGDSKTRADDENDPGDSNVGGKLRFSARRPVELLKVTSASSSDPPYVLEGALSTQQTSVSSANSEAKASISIKPTKVSSVSASEKAETKSLCALCGRIRVYEEFFDASNEKSDSGNSFTSSAPKHSAGTGRGTGSHFSSARSVSNQKEQKQPCLWRSSSRKTERDSSEMLLRHSEAGLAATSEDFSSGLLQTQEFQRDEGNWTSNSCVVKYLEEEEVVAGKDTNRSKGESEISLDLSEYSTHKYSRVKHLNEDVSERESSGGASIRPTSNVNIFKNVLKIASQFEPEKINVSERAFDLTECSESLEKDTANISPRGAYSGGNLNLFFMTNPELKTTIDSCGMSPSQSNLNRETEKKNICPENGKNTSTEGICSASSVERKKSDFEEQTRRASVRRWKEDTLPKEERSHHEKVRENSLHSSTERHKVSSVIYKAKAKDPKSLSEEQERMLERLALRLKRKELPPDGASWHSSLCPDVRDRNALFRERNLDGHDTFREHIVNESDGNLPLEECNVDGNKWNVPLMTYARKRSLPPFSAMSKGHPETDLVMYGRTGQQECVSLHSSITSCPMEEYYETLSEMDDFDKGVAKKKKVGVAVREPSLDVCRHPILGKLHPCCRPEMEGKTVVDVQNATEAFCILRRSLLFKKIDKLSPLFEVSDHKKLSFVVLADTHGQEDYLRYPIPPADVLLHAGDFSHHGTLAELKKFNDWIGRLPHRFKVVIAGNHDVALYDRDDLMPYDKCAPEKARASLTNCVYLEDSGCEILGVKIWGSPWTPTWGTRGFQVNRGLPIAEKWALIPAGTDLLMTHGPPVGHCDFAANNQYAGDVNLLYEVQNRVKPKIHVFGHIHEAYGLSTDGNTIYINAATCNRGLRPIRPAVYFELELPPGRSKNEVGWGKGGPDCFTSCTR